MSQRKRGITLPELSILSRPDSQELDTKNGARAGAGRREDDAMSNVARMQLPPKQSLDFMEIKSEAETKGRYHFSGKEEMLIEEWARVGVNPRQRDTEKHARAASKSHLKDFDPIHAMVSMAVLPDGTRYKLDGHTRSLLWSRGELAAPPSLIVDVWACDSIQAVKTLYLRFDAKAAVENASDQVQGAARESGLVFQTPMLRDGNYGSAIKRIYMIAYKSNASWKSPNFVYEAVKHFKEELKVLDLAKPQPSVYTSGIIGAALVTLKRRGAAGLPFWEAYSENAGTKADGEMDGIQALLEAVAKAKAEQASGIYQQVNLLYRGIAAHEGYRLERGYPVKRALRPMKAEAARIYMREAAKNPGSFDSLASRF